MVFEDANVRIILPDKSKILTVPVWLRTVIQSAGLNGLGKTDRPACASGRVPADSRVRALFTPNDKKAVDEADDAPPVPEERPK